MWLCPDGTSQSANCASGKSPSANEITALQKTIRDELNDVVSNIDYVSKQDFYDSTFTKQYPNGEFQGRTLTADDMQDSLWLKLKDPTKYQVVSEVLSGKEGVEDVTDQRQIFDPVFAVLNRATAVTAVLAGVMVVVAILLTGTTIRMSAASRRTETEIMRYVGASNWTIRLPFILEGAIASLIGSVLSCLMLSAIVNVFVTGWLAQRLEQAGKNTVGRYLLANLAGLAVVYAMGMVYYYIICNYVINTPIALWPLFLYCFLLAVPGDLCLSVLGAVLVKRVKPALSHTALGRV